MIRLFAVYCVCFIHLARAQTTTSCATPNGEQGNCIALQQCPSLYNPMFLTLAQRQQIELHQCGDTSNPQNVFVCCPPVETDERFGGQRQTYRPTYQSPYRPSSTSLSYNDYMSHYRPNSASPTIGGFNSNQNQYRPPSTSSLFNLFNYQTTNRPSQASNQYQPNRRRFTESDLPPAGRCGNQAKDRIFGGTDAGIRDYPWMTLIHYSKRGRAGGFFCGGALIHEKYVITAAHCISGTSLTKAGYAADSVRLGEHDLSSTQDCEEGECADPVQNIDVAQTIVHEQYEANADSQGNDIALIRLARAAPYTDFIRPICLPVASQLRNKNFDGAPLVVAGFGKTEYASRSEIKQQLEVSGVNTNRCDEIYQRYLGLKLNSKQLCAGGVEGEDSCSGDSGGPLMGLDRSNPTNPYVYLAGIVSLGPTKCGTAGYPGVYTRTEKYIDWILSHMEK